LPILPVEGPLTHDDRLYLQNVQVRVEGRRAASQGTRKPVPRPTKEVPFRLSRVARATLRALLDTLIPDGEFPGHARTRVLPRLLAEIRKEPGGPAALEWGLAVLDARAERLGAASFARLAPEERRRAVAWLETLPDGTRGRNFYLRLSRRAMRLHYTHEAAWAPLGHPLHAPQPLGFLDYAEPIHRVGPPSPLPP
jgi:hypothetical protein